MATLDSYWNNSWMLEEKMLGNNEPLKLFLLQGLVRFPLPTLYDVYTISSHSPATEFIISSM